MTITTTITDIPLSKLTSAKPNVRKTSTATLEPLIASIRAHGLIQNLTVRPILNKKGVTTGRYAVVAGNRRLAALKALAEAGEIEGNTSLPCHMLDDTNSDTEIGLAENVVREAMHPADQFEAFDALAKTGTPVDDIAARFGVSVLTVRQRLKLASVSPALFDAYRAGDMTLEQLMAFTIHDDHAEQEKVWEALPSWNRHAHTIRRALTAEAVPSTDKRVKLVGLDAYEAAGGAVRRDLFDSEQEGYLTDPVLLDRLVTERLTQEAERLTAEGWVWASVTPDLDYQALSAFIRAYPEQVDLSESDQAALDAAVEAYDALAEEHDEEPDDPDTRAEIERLSDEIDRLTDKQQQYPEDIKATHGCLVGLSWSGEVQIVEGLRSKSEEKEASGPWADDGTDRDGEPPAPQAKLSPKLIAELIAHRTAALRAELLKRPDLALILTVHKLALRHFYAHDALSCLDLRAESDDLTRHGDSVTDNPGHVTMQEERGRWQLRLPSEAKDLWDRLLSWDDERIMGLLAYLTASALEPAPASSRAKRHADQLAETVSLDMTQYWQATPATFFRKVTKAVILEAVTESVSKQAADNLASLKKDALIEHAANRMAHTQWLPEPLRALDDPDEALAA